MLSEGPSPLRVLVADRCADAADQLVLLLTQLGYEVRTAPSGADFLRLTETFWPDVAFVELVLPDLDGYQLAQRLRGQADRKRPLLVALTVLEGQEHRQLAHEAGFDYFITKPGRLGRFLQSLAKMCSWRAASGASLAETTS